MDVDQLGRILQLVGTAAKCRAELSSCDSANGRPKLDEDARRSDLRRSRAKHPDVGGGPRGPQVDAK